MEKYSKWTDKSTGVNPFVPFGQWNPNLPRFILFFPIILLKFILYNIFSALTSVSTIFFRALLLLCGIWRVNETHWNATTGREHNNDNNVSSGTVPTLIVSNHVSYLDVFYFAWKYPSAKFIAMFVDELDGDVKYVPQSAWDYVQLQFLESVEGLLQYRKVKNGLTMQKLMQEMQSTNGIYVFFFEATTTNGRGLLSFPGKERDLQLVSDLVERNNVNVHLVALNYEIGQRKNTDMSFNPAFHMDNFTSHMLGLFSQFHIPMEVKHLHCGKNLFDNQMFNARKYIAAGLTGVQALGSVNLVDKRDFMKYWERTQAGY